MPDRDRFGGDARTTWAATGSFRLQDGGRWWFVTPDGHPFLSWGLNHVGLELLRRPYNGEHWAAEIAGQPEAWLRQRAADDLARCGMNTLGGHNPEVLRRPPFVPYVQPLRFVALAHWQEPAAADFLDVFAPAFASHCDRLAADLCARLADDPWLLGYGWTDCPILSEADAAPRGSCVLGRARPGLPTWPRVLRNLPPEAPGKQAWVSFIRTRYPSIEAFNRAYHLWFADFEALAAAVAWRPLAEPGNAAERADNEQFLEQVVERYYRVAHDAIRRYDPRHLIFGDYLNGNVGVDDGVLAVIGRHVDALIYQWYGWYDEQAPTLDRWHAVTGRPLLNGDSSYSVPCAEMPFTLGPHCRDQEHRAGAFREFAEQAFARPDFLGWHWCGWLDSWEVGQPERQHAGIFDAFGQPHGALRSAMEAFGERLYDVANSAL